MKKSESATIHILGPSGAKKVTADKSIEFAYVMAVLQPWDKACRDAYGVMIALGNIIGDSDKLGSAVDGVINGYTAFVAEKLGEAPELLEEWLASSVISGEPMVFTWQDYRNPEKTSRHSIASLAHLAEFIASTRQTE